ncbi:hypothetical protein Q8A67_022728 [Cirrhinus molitorella]|uniref:Uncharacterized protein n=1 Tax=Cirrhinus molitorella TaxID=172907 RepID=A0AA88P8F1_9TELE|nr:hypothetical protein Q8A67_022728 [Cirrhinus molitorella]
MYLSRGTRRGGTSVLSTITLLWGSVKLEISTAMVTCLPSLQQLIGFAYSRLTLSHRPGPSGILASHSVGASPLLPLPLTLPHPEEKSRARSLLRSEL